MRPPYAPFREEQPLAPRLKEPPVVECVRRIDSLIVLSCPYCGGEHWHGGGEGHRVAHCYRPKIHPAAGYILKVIGTYRLSPVPRRRGRA